MSEPSPKQVQETVEKSVSLVEWIAELWRGRNWVKKLVFLSLICIGAWRGMPWLAQRIDYVQTVEPYHDLLLLAAAALFVAAIVVAIRTKPSDKEAPVRSISEESLIKGLRPFLKEDASLFLRLQREVPLRDWITTISSRDFRFGVLFGESGCGKTSFLQAGLWPGLSTNYCCVYVKLSNHDPLDSFRSELVSQRVLSQDKVDGVSFLGLLEAATEATSKTVVVLLDQFEQFFVHRRTETEREPFVEALTNWYHSEAPSRAKVLISIRGDMLDRLSVLHEKMQYALGPQEYRELKKFTPEEATAIFRVMAEEEGLDFDEPFVKELTRQELADSQSGLVSAANIQVLAWLIRGQETHTDRAFDRVVFQKLGGMEGLLEGFLAHSLDVRETASRREATLKVLLALTDLETHTRAGILTLDQLQGQLSGSVQAADVQEAVSWLARTDIRLVTPSGQAGVEGYELAHESLIPALRRLAGKELTPIDQANRLLDRRVNEWLGNEQSRRYLLSWRELRLIASQQPHIIFGSKKAQKEVLIERSRRRWQFRMGVAAVVALCTVGAAGWWYSPWGQIWQIERELLALSERVRDDKALVEAAEALAENGNFQYARTVAEKIADPDDQSRAYIGIAQAAATLNDSAQAGALLTQARTAAEKIADPRAQSWAYIRIAQVAATLNDSAQAGVLLTQARMAAEKIFDPAPQSQVYVSIAQAAATLNDSAQAGALLTQARMAAEKIFDPAPQSQVYVSIAQAAATLNDSAQAGALLTQARMAAEKIFNPDAQSQAYVSIAQAAATLNDSAQAGALLTQVRTAAEKTFSPYAQSQVYVSIAQAAATLNDSAQAGVLLTQARMAAEKISWPAPQSQVYVSIAQAAATLNDSAQAGALLIQARTAAEKISSPYFQSQVYVSIAQAAATLNDSAQAGALLIQVRTAAEKISGPKAQSQAYLSIAQAFVKKENLWQAHEIAGMSQTAASQMRVLSNILKTWRAPEKR